MIHGMFTEVSEITGSAKLSRKVSNALLLFHCPESYSRHPCKPAVIRHRAVPLDYRSKSLVIITKHSGLYDPQLPHMSMQFNTVKFKAVYSCNSCG